MKKIQASLIKMLMRISSQLFVSSILELSLYSLSHNIAHLEFLEHCWRTLGILWIWSRRKRKSKKAQGNIGINNYNEFFLQVMSCMHDFITIFDMHGICMWLLGYGLSLAWRIAWNENCFSQTYHFWIAMLFWVLYFVLWLVLMFLMVMG